MLTVNCNYQTSFTHTYKKQCTSPQIKPIKYQEDDDTLDVHTIEYHINQAEKQTGYQIFTEILLGEGATSKVYKGFNCKTKKYVAVKVLDHTESTNSSCLEEFEILNSLDHDNIIKVYSTFKTDQYTFFFMEYLKKELLSLLLEKEFFTEKETINITKQLLSAVQYLHSKNIVHRDLKLENMLVQEMKDGSYSIKLIDFGQAKYFEENEVMTKICGSLFYLPPEIMQRSYNYKCDMWSLGVIVYSLLTGHFPFDSENDEEIYEKIAFSKVQFSKMDKKHISKTGQHFVKKLLQRKVYKRLDSAEALAQKWLKKWSYTILKTTRCLTEDIIF